MVKAIWNSLFAKVYLTLLVSLLVVVLAFGGVWRFAFPGPDRADRFPKRLLETVLPPASASQALQREAIRRIADLLDAEITLRLPDGSRIAAIGDPETDKKPDGLFGTEKRTWRVRLPDGRAIAARFEAPWQPPGRRLFYFVIVIALAVALAALPVVRLVTRRLERLRRGVDHWGTGDLSYRVDDTGSDEVAALARSFNASADRIEALMQAHRSLLANASHELRSPLTRLRLAIDLEAVRPSAERRAEIVRNLEEIDELVEEILLASRLDRPDLAIAMSDVDLAALVQAEAADATCLLSTGIFVRGDPKLLKRLVRNLIDNARRHGKPPIEINLSAAGGNAVLEVRDHGLGMLDAAIPRLFEPFFRPEGRSESAGGWGLGLSLVRQIARRHYGDAVAQNAVGGGALFTVTLPLSGLPV